jgi:hypothetical protein
VNWLSASQYSLNYVASIARQILHFIRSVPVMSIKTFLVLSDILVVSLLIIGGKLST